MSFDSVSHDAYRLLPIASMAILALTLGSRLFRVFVSVPWKFWLVLVLVVWFVWYVASNAGYIT